MKTIDIAINSLLFTIPLVHLLISPYTKVEESFNIQAIHDILVYGTPLSNVNSQLSQMYDHISFPGAVPRTFLGALVLSWVSKPFIALVGFQHAQVVVRALLGLFNSTCLFVFSRAMEKAFGRVTARWWVAFTVSQFHVCYYQSRTLPNMFAFGLTTLALAFLIPESHPQLALRKKAASICLLVISTTIFRSEIAILLITTSFYLLITRRITLGVLVPVFLIGFIGSLAISVPIDSYFWQKPLWPELWGFYYNAIQGSSSDWGVSPWHYYFSSALPKLLLNPLVLVFILVQPGTSRQAQALVIPSILYVAIYSFQPHKEARFIFYVVPSLTGAAALGATFISTRVSKSAIFGVVTFIALVSVVVSFAASIGMLVISSLNYPGGEALSQLYSLTSNTETIAPSSVVSVHADVLTCMTGLTLLGQNPAGLPLALGSYTYSRTSNTSTSPILLFDKTEDENELLVADFWTKFDYVLAEDPSKVLGDWEVLGVVRGYDGIEVLKGGEAPNIEAETLEKPLGIGTIVHGFKNIVRQFTGGWWVGPRMSPRIRILKQVRDDAATVV